MAKINPNQALQPLIFSSCFSFGYGTVHPQKMAGFLRQKGFSTLPITEMLSSAGLSAAISAAKSHDMKLLYGQRIRIDGAELLLYPDDRSAFVWLHQSCSQILRARQVESCRQNSAIEPIGKGRVILDISTPESIFARFIDAGWQTFVREPASLKLEFHRRVEEIKRKFSIHSISCPEIRYTCPLDIKTAHLISAIKSSSLLNLTPAPDPDWNHISRKNNFCPSPDDLKRNLEFGLIPGYMPETGVLKMPKTHDSVHEAANILKEKCEAGLLKKYRQVDANLRDRLRFELKTIQDLGFTDYFLVVDEIAEMARAEGVRVLGRGSAANSLVSYLLDFTQVDPIRHGLYFERFLNPHRKSPPDIDLDFSWKIRDRIYQFLSRRWGWEKVALISTHITLSNRSAVREAGKALGITSSEIDYLCSLTGHSSLNEFLNDPQKHARCKPDMKRLSASISLLKLAAAIEGLPTHFSIHAGGVVIAPDNLFNFTITEPSSKALPITHLEMHGCEKLGLVKFDLLSQRALGAYAEISEKIAAENPGNKIPFAVEELENDPKVAEKLSRGDTLGVFYIESPGMRSLLAKLQCSSFAGLTAASSIIRPGVAESGMMQEYIRRHLGETSWKPLHPLLQETLQDTYGVMVYQEDVMKVANRLAGFSPAEADILRRAMSGKERSQEQMAEARQKFMAGTAAKGISAEIAAEVWRQISSFCGYAFCKAHSAAYAVLSLQLLWTRCHFPLHFFAAIINNRGGFYSTQTYVSYALAHGLKFLQPNVNHSEKDLIVMKDSLLTGLSFISCLSRDLIERIIQQRKKRNFADLEDFLLRTNPNEKEFLSLTGSGSLRDFGSKAFCRWQFKLSGRLPGYSRETLPGFLNLPSSLRDELIDEIAFLGFAISGHPTLLVPLEKVDSTNLAAHTGKQVRVTGLLAAAKSVATSSGKKMKFLTIEDRFGLIEIVFFPNSWNKISFSLDRATLLRIYGTVQTDHGLPVIHGKSLELLQIKP